MLEGEDCHALYTLIENVTITSEVQKKPKATLDAIHTTNKEEKHFWQYMGELVSHLHERPYQPVYTLSNHITELITNYDFPDNKETPKSHSYIMPCGTIKYGIGSVRKTKHQSPMPPFSSTAISLIPHGNSLRGPRIEIMLSLPHLKQPQLQYFPYTKM